jgi:hypothetical protein
MVQKARKIEESRNKKEIISQKWYHDTKFVISSIIALIAIFYSITKDYELQQIKKRANGPFFVISTVLLDSNQSDGSSRYYYPKKPSDLTAQLMSMDSFEPRIPDDYPDNYPIGLLLKNTGGKLRSFTKSSKEQMVFQEVSPDKNLYELRYVYNKATKGKKFRFTLTFETNDGLQDSQVWEVTKGVLSIKRIKPKMP